MRKQMQQSKFRQFTLVNISTKILKYQKLIFTYEFISTILQHIPENIS